MSDTEAPEAQVGDVRLALSWRLVDGGLRGELEAVNVRDHRVRLSGKPDLTPVGIDGSPLAVETVVTMEFRHPGYVELGPGRRAIAPVTWAGWDGPPSSGRVIVRWDGGRVEVDASGPRQPANSGPATNLSTSWFSLLD